jgi:hypothetical protein
MLGAFLDGVDEKIKSFLSIDYYIRKRRFMG